MKNVETLLRLTLLPEQYGGKFESEYAVFPSGSQGYDWLSQESKGSILLDVLSNSGLVRLYYKESQLKIEKFYPFAYRFISDMFRISHPEVTKIPKKYLNNHFFFILDTVGSPCSPYEPRRCF